MNRKERKQDGLLKSVIKMAHARNLQGWWLHDAFNSGGQITSVLSIDNKQIYLLTLRIRQPSTIYVYIQ